MDTTTGVVKTDEALFNGLTGTQSLILRAILQGQTDITSLSTYANIKPNEVVRVIQDLIRKGKIQETGVSQSKSTSGNVSGSSSSFWKRVTSI